MVWRWKAAGVGGAVVAAAIALRAGGAGGVERAREARGAPADVVPPPPAPAAPADAGPAVTFPGVVVARRSAQIAAGREGRLAAVYVRPGDRVPAGGRIGSLDARGAGYDAKAAEAAWKTARLAAEGAAVEAAEAAASARRVRALADEKLAADEDLSRATYQESAAKLRAETAGAQAGERRVRFEQLAQAARDAEIVAPFEGVVAARYADPGAVVTASTPVVRLISADDRVVRFAVAESHAGQARVGRPVRVARGAGGAAVGGVVESVAPEIDPSSRTLVAEARLDAAPDGGAAPTAGEVVRVSWGAP
ncbi:MAG TPA: efflux RND transporter periplasmic adaptor subunit [Polyangiaceae bacterium]|nr:efflux RND transporter periplasmic adaptor subunit [Polyangiaceae bacterium]